MYNNIQNKKIKSFKSVLLDNSCFFQQCLCSLLGIHDIRLHQYKMYMFQQNMVLEGQLDRHSKIQEGNLYKMLIQVQSNMSLEDINRSSFDQFLDYSVLMGNQKFLSKWGSIFRLDTLCMNFVQDLASIGLLDKLCTALSFSLMHKCLQDKQLV